MTRWRQERPTWCPYPESCGFLRRTQDSACVGQLPELELHGGIENTHRLCLRGAPDDGEWLFDLILNAGDAWHLRRVLGAVRA